ncbi:MAG: DUF3987 domain-containing protein [Fermentimonas sp.]
MEKTNTTIVNASSCSESTFSWKNELIGQEVYDLLPELLKDITNPFVGRERDVVLLSSLTVLSNCIPNIYGIYDKSKIYPHLFLLIIAPPASGKGVMKFSKALIDPIHDYVRNLSSTARESCIEEKKKNNDKERRLDISDCPPIKTKIMAANTSSTKVYYNLFYQADGLLLMDSEIDSLVIVFRQHWGDFSDVLRKAFHNERISIDRVNEPLLEVIEPKLAVCLSGTYNQLLPLIKSKDNGLFSRFMNYIYDETPKFKDVFSMDSMDVRRIFEEKGQTVFKLYIDLSKREDEVKFEFTEEQTKLFRKEFGIMTAFLADNPHEYLISNLFRLGIIMFRVCMVLTAIRKQLAIPKHQLICDDVDFNTGLKIIKVLFNHLLYDSVNNYMFKDERDKALYIKMQREFKRQDFIELGQEWGLSTRMLDYILYRWEYSGLILRKKRGEYIKNM